MNINKSMNINRIELNNLNKKLNKMNMNYQIRNNKYKNI